MVRGNGSDLGREPGGAYVRQLVGVELGAQAELTAAAKDPARFLDGEGTLVAEDVAVAREVFLRDRGDHRLEEERHIFLAPAAVLIGNLVGAEEGRDDFHRGALARAPECQELLPLFVER